MTREYIALFFTIVFCPMLLVIFGNIYGNDPTPIFNNLGTVDISIPSYIGLVFAGSGFISMPVSVASSKERGELRRYQMTPISPILYLFTDVMLYFIVSVIGMLLLMGIGYFGWGAKFNGNVLLLILGFIVSGLSIFSIGLTIAAVSKNAKVSQALGMVVGFPMMFLSGAGMPLEMMPTAIKEISKYLPLSYSVSSMRAIWVGAKFNEIQGDILIMLGIATVFILVTFFTFRWD